MVLRYGDKARQTMTDKAFLNSLANDRIDIIQKLLDILSRGGIYYCVIGGLAVNAYVDPIVSLDLDIVVAAGELERLKEIAAPTFEIKEFEHSINFYSTGSDLRIQIQTDERYNDFISRASKRKMLGYDMYVASIEDVLQGKVWAYSDDSRRKSKRQKDLADIFRIIESYPHMIKQLPGNIKQII
ncbi:hypothetical protein LCGC14_2085680 [marine sediment metagenome]|uniref:Uncharacterized protein n=1 Tax=marine sediment metagenome TaxID=412755 RepID=A0A0F9HBA7_9ZZZZ